MRQQHPDAEVEVWAEDEHRVGLHPLQRRVWTPADEPPIAQVNCKYQWMWLAGFVCPTRGETDWWIVPCLNHQVVSQLLAEFAQHFELGAHKRVVLALDQAAFHTPRKGEGSRRDAFGVFAPEVARTPTRRTIMAVDE